MKHKTTEKKCVIEEKLFPCTLTKYTFTEGFIEITVFFLNIFGFQKWNILMEKFLSLKDDILWELLETIAPFSKEERKPNMAFYCQNGLFCL